MRSPDSLRVLLQIRARKEEIEERKLVAFAEKIRLAKIELQRLSSELDGITAKRMSEIQHMLPNVHHQEREMQSRALWRRHANHVAEIEKLKEIQAQQMSAYISAHRDREVAESLDKQRCREWEAARQQRQQKMNEDLFLARSVAKRDTGFGQPSSGEAKEGAQNPADLPISRDMCRW